MIVSGNDHLSDSVPVEESSNEVGMVRFVMIVPGNDHLSDSVSVEFIK